MATIKSEYYRFNGVSWDIHYFKTTMDMVDGLTSALAGKANLSGANFLGELTASSGLLMGSYIPSKGDGSTIYFGNDIKMLNQASGATGFYVNSAKQNRFYCLTQNGNYECFSNYRGNGVYSPSSLPSGLWYASTQTLVSTGESWELGRLFDNSFTTGATFPTTDLDVNPVVITIKTTGSSRIDYTDTSYLVINGWRYGGSQAASHYGTLNSYSVEICTDKINDTWIKILERIGVSDSIAGLHIPLWSSLGGAAGYTELYGIRLTIKGATQGGIAGQFGFAEIKLMENRPAGIPSDSVGALSLGGGTLYGDVILGSKYAQFIRPANDKTHYLGSSSQQFKAIYAEYVYANGQQVYHPNNKPTLAALGAAAASHTHAATDITSGRFALARFPTALAGLVLKGNGANDPQWGTVAWDEVVSKPTWIGASKPTYTAEEVGALPLTGGTLSGQLITTNSVVIGGYTYFNGLVTSDNDTINFLADFYNMNNGVITNLGTPVTGHQAANKDYVDSVAGPTGVITTTTSALTLSSTHMNKFVQVVPTSNPTTVTLNKVVSDDYSIGTEIHLMQYGSNTISIEVGTGLALLSVNSWKKISASYGVVTMKKIASATWVLFGALAA